MNESTNPRRRVIMAGVAAGAVGLAGCASLGVAVASQPATVTGRGTPAVQMQPTIFGYGGYGSSRRTGSSSAGAVAQATAAEQVGVVDIDTVLQYQGAEAAGTGLVLSSSGEILTNNHVIDGATSITVTVVSTGKAYPATVVGTDPSADVAVLQLANASGLRTAHLSTAAAAVGQAVTAVGNAGGVGGVPSAASGTVTALDQSITASDQNGSNAEQLTGLIETDAAVQSGDSGGPLYDASGAVIGIDTAASSGALAHSYAIPIATAESIATQIEDGVSSATIHQGYPAFLGVSVRSSVDGGAVIAGVLSGGPADTAGLAAGDVITAVDGQTIASAQDLTSALAAHRPGQRVTLTWADPTGATASATVTLAAGPAD